MTQDNVLTLEQAMEAVSDSIANLKRFTESLNKFLETNGLGSAEYSADYPAVGFEGGRYGYDIAMFHLRDRNGKDVIYFYVWTGGIVQGENFTIQFSLENKQRDLINDGCTYAVAAREVLKTVGVMEHSALSRQKIDKAIEALGG